MPTWMEATVMDESYPVDVIIDVGRVEAVINRRIGPELVSSSGERITLDKPSRDDIKGQLEQISFNRGLQEAVRRNR